VALLLLTSLRMPEPEDSEHHVERKVVYETVSSSSTRSTGITIAIVVIIALALVVWIVMQMR
jgi:uncharacterized protein HemX